jgi:hypothetical protein
MSHTPVAGAKAKRSQRWPVWPQVSSRSSPAASTTRPSEATSKPSSCFALDCSHFKIIVSNQASDVAVWHVRDLS